MGKIPTKAKTKALEARREKARGTAKSKLTGHLYTISEALCDRYFERNNKGSCPGCALTSRLVRSKAK